MLVTAKEKLYFMTDFFEIWSHNFCAIFLLFQATF